jgi:hypothetical protein
MVHFARRNHDRVDSLGDQAHGRRGVQGKPQSTRFGDAGTASSAIRTMFRSAVLVPDHEDTQAFIAWRVNDRIRKAAERKPTPTVLCRRSELRVLHEQTDHTFEFKQEAPRHGSATFPTVKASGTCDVIGRTAV